MVEGRGVPLAARVSAANVNDITMLLATVTACPLAGYGKPGRRPRRLLGDRAYDSEGHEGIVRWLEIEPCFAQRGQGHGSGLGKERYVVEQTLAALHQNRRLKVRYERRLDIHQAFLIVACIKVCWYRLNPDRK
jgi:DDE family transposase